jgi:lipopolysaccharide biosynthesis glycosyltransferase
VCHHKKGPLFKDEIFIPIHVGSANSAEILPDCLRDDVGDNISAKNTNFCELTAMYWALKNVEADYYGFFHYRRFLNFDEKRKKSVIFRDFSPETIRNLRWNRQAIETLCTKYDIITLPRWNVHPSGLPNEQMTNYEFYARDHYVSDLDLVLSVIKKRSPNVYPFVLFYIHGNKCCYGNISIMRSDFFKQYASWLFDIIFECEKSVDISSYDTYQRRIWGFIAERLCGAYVDFLVASEGARTGELGLATGIFSAVVTESSMVLRNIETQRAAAKTTLTPDMVHIAFSIDDNYAPHCGVAIASMLANVHPNQKLTIHILHDDTLSLENKKSLVSISRNNFVVFNFIGVNQSDFKRYPNNRSHISSATYYRLALHRLLPENIEKIIYLDADIIVEDNITQLWIELDDQFAAACADEGGILQSRRLKLPVSHTYFNAGVMVFNLKKLRETGADILYLESFLMMKKNIIMQDQDILNLAFLNKTKELPLRWNANGRLFTPNDLEYKYSDSEAAYAALNPGIIHYTDASKPWSKNCVHPLTSLYWHWRLQTPWAQEKVAERKIVLDPSESKTLFIGKRLERRLRPFFKKLFSRL